MLADSFRRIRPRQWLRKAVRTWLGLFAQRLFLMLKLFEGLKVGLYVIPWHGDLATKDSCHSPIALCASASCKGAHHYDG